VRPVPHVQPPRGPGCMGWAAAVVWLAGDRGLCRDQRPAGGAGRSLGSLGNVAEPLDCTRGLPRSPTPARGATVAMPRETAHGQQPPGARSGLTSLHSLRRGSLYCPLLYPDRDSCWVACTCIGSSKSPSHGDTQVPQGAGLRLTKAVTG